MLPLEFVVLGIPISSQASGPSRQAWKAKVAAAAKAVIPAAIGPVNTDVRLTVVYYYDGAPLDVDNMLKPIQDALNGIVYVDDAQISDTSGSKRSLNGSYRVRGLNMALASGFSSGSDFVFVRIENAPDIEVLI